jgi:peptidoglycan/xylan/chitin deacetylase (PgdA/CDA1 family)
MPHVKHQGGTLFTRSFLLAAALAAPACQGGSVPFFESQENAVLTAGQLNGDSLPNKTVVFTFDDGPDEHTLELAQYLNEQGVRATFFINGRRLCKTMGPDGTCMVPQDTRACNDGQMQAAVQNPKYYPESLLDQVLALGHRLGNHSQDHCHLPGQTNATDLAWELKTTQDILDRHVCDGVVIFRAPFGEWNGTVSGRINGQMGFNSFVGPVNWDVDGNDWDCWRNKATPEACANKYMTILNGRAKQNGIFLMHDRPEFNVGYEGPLLMAKVLVPRLKAAGFKFGTLDEALKLSPKDAGTCMPPASPADAGNDAGVKDASSGETAGSGGAGGSSQGGSSGSGGTSGGSGGSASGSGGSSDSSGGSSGSSGGSSGSSSGGGSGSGGRKGTGGSESVSPPSSGGSAPGGCSYGGSSPSWLALGLMGLVLGRLRRRR